MKSVVRFIPGVLAIAMAMPALAVTAKTGVFVLGGLGVGSTQTPTSEYEGTGVTESTISTAETAWAVGVGYNDALTSHMLVGGEVDYAMDGAADYSYTDGAGKTSGKIRTHSMDFLGDATYLWQNGFNLFGKLGVARLSQDATISGANNNGTGLFTPNSNQNKTAYKAKMVLGLGYAVSDAWNLTLSFIGTGGDKTTSYPVDTTKVYATSSVLFGTTSTFSTN